MAVPQHADCVPGTITDLIVMNYSSMVKIFFSFWAVFVTWIPVLVAFAVVLSMSALVLFKCCGRKKEIKSFVVVDHREADDYNLPDSYSPRSKSHRRSSSRPRHAD